MNRNPQEVAYAKRAAVDAADAAGQIADSIAVRAKLIAQWHAGEKTLAQIQAELRTIQRAAKKNGTLTRSQVYSRA